jgi:integrase
MRAPKPREIPDSQGGFTLKPTRIERRDDLSPLWLRITSRGDRSFSVRVRIKGQAQPIRLTYDAPAHTSTLERARVWAVEMYRACQEGRDPREEKRTQEAAAVTEQQFQEAHAIEKVAAAFLATNGVIKKNSRPWRRATSGHYAQIINQRIIPKWKGRTIHSITRDEIVDYLAEVAETAPVGANRILAVLSGIMAWYQTQRGTGFTSPVVEGMAPSEETARDRTLTDDEIRIIWHVAGRTGVYGGMIRTLLLNGCRRGEVAAMRRSEIGEDNIWALPGEFTKNHLPLYLPLSQDSLALIAEQPRAEGQDLVFSFNGKDPFNNWSRSKELFDRRILCRLKARARAEGEDPVKVRQLPNWTLHDLRRTARSLMSRARVRPDHAERVVNHKIGGIEGVYDRYNYLTEKRDALERLAWMLRQIIQGEPAKVVPFRPLEAAE